MANIWDDAFERASPPEVIARDASGWGKVHWAANDRRQHRLSPRRRQPAQGRQPFQFTPEDLELLIKANAFEPIKDRGKIIFALRGAELVASGGGRAEDKFRQVGRKVLNLRETRPDHQHFRCVIGVYDMAQKQLSAFIGSTVPCRQAVYSYANGGGAATCSPPAATG